MRTWQHNLGALSPGEPALALYDDRGRIMVSVDPWPMRWREGRGLHQHLHITSSAFRIELTVSPQGKNERLFINGREVHW